MNGKLLFMQQVRNCLNHQREMLLLMFFLLTAFGVQAQTVTSDKDDYAPGEIAIITGSGWMQDEYVDIHLEEEPIHDHDHDYHDTKVNADGTWRIEYPIEQRHIGVKFTVEAIGKQSNTIAYTYFTDGNVNFGQIGVPGNNIDMQVIITYTKPDNSVVTESITFKSNGTTAVGAKDNTVINWDFKPVTVGGTTYVWDGTSTHLQGFNIGTANYTGKDAIKGTYVACVSPTVNSQPGNQTVTYGSNGTFNVSAFGAGPYTYQWQVKSGADFTNIIGATSASLTLTKPDVALNNSQYRVIISNSCGSVTSTAASLAVNSLPITIKANNQNKVYGNALTLGSTTFSVDASTPMASGESIGSVTLSSAGAVANADVATYSIVPSAAVAGLNTNLANYAITYSNGTLTVTPAPATITVAGLSKTYTGSAQGATVTTSPLNLAYNVTYAGDATVPTNAGSYAVLAALNNSNYTAANATGTLVIAKAPTSTVVTASGGPYNGESFAGTAVVTGANNLNTSLPVTYAGVAPTVYAPSSQAPTEAGTYTAAATYAESPNYFGSSASQSFTIGKAANSISFSNPGTQTYAPGATLSLSATAVSGAAVSFSVISGKATVNGSTLTIGGAGNITVQASSGTTANYLAAADKSVTFTVNKATATLELANLSHTYDGTKKSATAATSPVELTGVSISNNGKTDAGSYAVTASLDNDNYEAESVSGNLLIEKANQAITWNAPAAITYGTALSGSQLNASALEGALLTYSPAAGTVLDAGSQTLTVNAAATANYKEASKAVTLIVDKANATIVVNGYTGTYDGNAHGASGAAKGVNNENLAGLDLGASFTNAPGGTAHWTFTDMSGNYHNSQGEAAIVINKAASATVVTINGGPFTYTGSAITPATVRVTGAGSLDLTPAATYANNVNAGTATASYFFAGDDNHEQSSGSQTFTINKATATLTLSDLTHTYDGTVKSATAATSPVKLTGVSISNNGKTDAGSYAVTASLDNANYEAESVSGNLVIEKANQAITWTTPAAITYGTALSATQLNASVAGVSGGSAAGDLSYNKAIGDVLNAGSHTLTATAAATNNYNSATASVILTVNKADQVITWATPGNMIYGTALSGSQLNATVLEGALLTYSPAAGTVLDAGSQTLTVNAAATANYKEGSKTVTLVVEKANATVTVARASGDYNSSTYDATGSATGIAGVALVPAVSFAYERSNSGTWSSISSAPSIAGSYRVKAVFAGNLNYNSGASEWSTFTINKATPAFSGLASSTINCGFGSVTLSGAVTMGALVPTGSVAISLNGVKQLAAVQANGTFTSTFNTASLTAAATAYTATYEYTGDGNFNAITDNSKGVTVLSVAVDANANSTPQPVKSTATIISISVKNSLGAAASGVPVQLYFDDKTFQPALTALNGVVTFNVGILPTGVFKVRAIAGAGCDETIVYLPVYDPNGGFVTGGGWIESPKGAYKANMDLAGKANFGFVAKYKKGSTIPDGSTEFQFKAGDLNFNSSAYDDMRLVVAGAKANYKGTGRINGTGNYGFMVSAIDGEVTGGGGIDKFRIKIWDKNNGDALVYDNNLMNSDDNADPATAISGGSIVIHDATIKGGSSTSKLIAAAKPAIGDNGSFYNYPNPYTDRTVISFATNSEENYALEVYDVKGALIKRVEVGVAEAGKVHEYSLDTRHLPEGIYFARLISPSKVQTLKMVLKR